MTSHDVVGRLRRVTGQRQIGHTGTLDPIATGLMVCVLGHATRLASYLSGMEKGYECAARMGIETDTYDIAGRVTAQCEAIPSDRGLVEAALARFAGEIEQRPPVYSAVKVKGRRLYKYARSNEAVEAPQRRVRIHRITLLDYQAPDVRFFCHVSSGAYVRSLCHDLGSALGCGACMTALRRTFVGPFQVDDAVRLERLEAEPDEAARRLIAMSALVPGLPVLRADAEGGRLLACGAACPVGHLAPREWEELDGQTALVCDEGEAAIALVRLEGCDARVREETNGAARHGIARPLRVFAHQNTP